MESWRVICSMRLRNWNQRKPGQAVCLSLAIELIPAELFRMYFFWLFQLPYLGYDMSCSLGSPYVATGRGSRHSLFHIKLSAPLVFSIPCLTWFQATDVPFATFEGTQRMTSPMSTSL